MDLGTVWPNSVTSREVWLRNGSSETWQLARLSGDCGCLAQSLSPELLPPNESAVLRFSFTAPGSVGRVSRRLYLAFVEASAPAVTIQIEGMIEPWCHAIPAELDLGESPEGTDRTASIRALALHLREGETLDLQTGIAAPPWLQVTFPDASAHQTVAGGSGGVVVAHVVPVISPGLEGVVAGLIRFQSADGSAKSLEVPVRMTLGMRLSVKPERLFLGERRCSEQFAETLWVSSSRLPGAELQDRLRITHDLGPSVMTTAAALDDADGVKIECQFTMPEQPGYWTGALQLRCGERDVVTVPVAARVE
ncbi:MAG: DUF1573 domain-containing protein [Planctomycetaceae bacterium]|nr:DUF1573 domain-containing protein [Planctomycetaceae bacterium]